MFKEKYYHVIIAIHPMMNIYINELLNNINSSDYIILEIYKNKILDNNKNLIRYNSSNKLEFFQNLYKIKNQLKKIKKDQKNIHYYIPHPIHIITNFIGFSLLRKEDKISLVADGIMNYYNCDVIRFKNKMLFLKFFSYLININYKVFNDHCTAYNIINYDTLFVLHGKGISSLNNSMKLKVLKIKKLQKLQTNNSLILGQPYLNSDVKNKLIIKQIELISKKSENIFYKPHPSEKINIDTLSLLNKYKIEVINGNKPIEENLNEYSIYISTTSSALMNIKIINPNIECIACLNDYKLLSYAEKNLTVELLEKLKKTFKSIGVSIYD